MEQKLTAIAQNSVELHNRCKLWHYGTVIPGDGTDKLTFKLPFKPDSLQIFCTDPRILPQQYTVSFLNADLAGIGRVAAVSNTANNGNLVNLAMTTDSILNRVSQAEDGTVTVSNITEAGNTCTFGADLPYVVIATRYTDKTYRQRFEEFVESLTGSGTCHICKTKVYEAFTEAEWTALKATRPNWTFQEV